MFLTPKTSIESSPNKNPYGVLPDHFAIYPAYPNPSDGLVIFNFATPVAMDWELYIMDDNYRVLRSFGGFTEAGVTVIIWDCTDEYGRKVAGDVYRVVYKWLDMWGYGDIWIGGYQLPDQHD